VPGTVMYRVGIASVLVLLLGAGAMAQRPSQPPSGQASSGSGPQQSFKWWQSENIRTDIGLTAEQVTRLEEIFQALLPRLTTGKDELDRIEKRLSSMVRDDALSEAEVMKQVDRVETARAELSKVRTLMFFRMHRVLTPEQRTKMDAARAKSERERQGAHKR
jgi:Spy/CpxP family protein refolding chaperone